MNMRNSRGSLVFIFITLLIDVLGFGIVIPVLPHLVTELSGGNQAHGARLLGLLFSAFGLMQFLFSPILGNLSDRFGRRPVLLISLASAVVDYVIMALAPNVGWLFVGRILTGMSSASYTVASAFIADVTPPEKRAESFGLLGAAFGVGFILGPAAGGLLGMVSDRAPFWAAAALALANGIYGAFVLPESLKKEDRRPFTLRSANPIRGLGVLGRYRWVLAMTGALVLMGLAQQALQSTWVLYTTYRYHWKPLDNGLSLALIGLCVAIVQAVIIRSAVPKLGERRAVIVGMTVNIVGFLGFALATRGWMMYPTIVVWCLSGISGPALQSLLSKQFPSNEQGGVQGALTSVQSLTGVVGPIIATQAFAYFTSATAPIKLPGAPFFLGAALIAIATVLARIAMGHHEEAHATEPEEMAGV
jgi:DHA1 family tetracycline resistance protein-like MFS transporter